MLIGGGDEEARLLSDHRGYPERHGQRLAGGHLRDRPRHEGETHAALRDHC